MWPLWKGCECREIKLGVNVWPVHGPKTSGRCREVAVIGGSTVHCILFIKLKVGYGGY